MKSPEEARASADPALYHDPVRAQDAGAAGHQRHPTLHPVIYGISVAGLAWIVLVAALAYGQGGVMGLVMVVVAGTLGAFVALPAAASGLIRVRNSLDPNRPGPDEGAVRPNLRAWLRREMPVWGGGLKGGAAAWQVALLPILLALGFTVMALIAVWARSGLPGA